MESTLHRKCFADYSRLKDVVGLEPSSTYSPRRRESNALAGYSKSMANNAPCPAQPQSSTGYKFPIGDGERCPTVSNPVFRARSGEPQVKGAVWWYSVIFWGFFAWAKNGDYSRKRCVHQTMTARWAARTDSPPKLSRANVVFCGLAWWPPLSFTTQNGWKNHRLSWHCRFIRLLPSSLRLAGSEWTSLYSQTWKLRPPKGLGVSGPIFQVVSFARFGSKLFKTWLYTCPFASHDISDRWFPPVSGGRIWQQPCQAELANAMIARLECLRRKS